MTCEHLLSLEHAIVAAGFPVTFRGKPWSMNCNEWVYFDCVIPLAETRRRFALADCVTDHVHRGTHDGSEAGFVCGIHHDAVMGLHPSTNAGARRFAIDGAS
jgi:hypothetical protein